jgi:hypothetical protein
VAYAGVVRIDSLTTRGASLLRVAVVALAAHAVVYHSLLPEDGVHGYLGWYEPLVGGLSAVALLVALVAVLARVTGIAGSWTRRLAPAAGPSRTVSTATAHLAAKAIAFLALQETLERSIPARSLELVQFTPVEWLVVLCATACIALVLVSAGRGARLLARRLSRPRLVARSPRGSRCLPARSISLLAWAPLASFGGLRAPPALIRA